MNSKDAALARKLMREQGKDLYRDAPLEGMRVRLTVSGDPAYLVGGMGPMTGGDNRWYWLVQQSRSRASILLQAATGCVHIDNRTTGGYRDVATEWQAAGCRVVREYRWNGKSYTLFRERREDCPQ